MIRDATVWLAASLVAAAVVANVAWWAGERAPARRAERMDAGAAVFRWLYLGALPLVALGTGVAPLWLAGWVVPASWPAAVAGAFVAAGAGAAAIRLPVAGRTGGPAGVVPLRRTPARIAAALADVVLREAHWGFVRAGVVAAAPGWFAVPGGTRIGLGQLAILGVLVLEFWAQPQRRQLATDPDGPAAAIGASAAASHLGWLLAGSAWAGLAAHTIVALVALVAQNEKNSCPPDWAAQSLAAKITPKSSTPMTTMRTRSRFTC